MYNDKIGCNGDDSLSDEQLIERIRNGNETAFESLSKRYAPLIYGKSAEFSRSISFEDKDDLVQESYIVFLHAVNSYRTDKNVSFKTYVNRCIFNKLSSVYANEKRKKKIPYNCIVPIDSGELSDIGGGANPEQQYIDNEGFADLQKKIKKSLSSFEQKVLSHYLSGSSYVQTARSLNTTVKAVDNALSRIRKKLRCI
ncbi:MULTISPECIES: sigma-70 family RNA polymerase sigma factor [unclassified Ruminococcus]|uniref:sigma-70 family RNA polymerase sigma factor n=1 Tax=unclassified Ruminococcus TaxID=2608920 RepID=UPI00210DF5F3|nr:MULTISPECIES: sigma-70 family RNA polymerase sigma factor [unclassified Ruminococcus]MCQ4021424.1 sigma-70 family RNA polymerase sigma factor [Ruminococcus sp. zg-924]MCQ4113869.1 sigma-70 family RNA polymerase sigma factor [Ruminococcus sp. zg-921]